jgi:Protein of unknown function (DUF2505)
VDFHTAQTLRGSPVAVQELLLDPGFIAARSELPKLGGAELLESTRDDTTAHLRVRFRFTAELSPAVTAVVDRDKLTWVDDARLDLTALEASHTIEPDNYADRLRASYRSVLQVDGIGTRRVLTGIVKVRMLLVGGKVEGAIVSGLQEYAVAEEGLLNDWLDR